ncbi:alpha-2-macroglobulin family protein [Falsiroseomonas selenitidurans]|uniref:Alpha-2-macroglobulin family protein n=1 Tax=Falsiroseomonas selenitidurans TaxID=2716335 RepID=A0ABX1E5C6_9PROT|nr:alpha-2-macroglobulin [Falsiroseomonas selenitidurans]NKC30972.1 alpha-2-macroglobulin family protein [Falsiroseomonas selenitidurans]
MFRLILPLLLVLGWLLPTPAPAFELPGLSNDASRYESALTRRFPAGGTPQQRAQAEARARAAEARQDWAAAAQAWEERIGAGQANADHWTALARAQLARTPPEARRALEAGWQAFLNVPGGPPEIPSLTVMAEALRRLGQPAWQIEALEAVVDRAPQDAGAREALAAARREAGLVVRRITTEPDAEPARACLAFTAPPARRTDWQPQDWLRADPPLPAMAVEREGDSLCVAGLPWGATTRLTLRAGMPGEDGLRVLRDTTLAIAMPNRAARIAFDNRAFLLPRGQPARVTVATVNVSALSLKLVRVTERNTVPLMRDWRPGQAMDDWMAENLSEDLGRVVWEGRAELPPAAANRLVRNALPLPDALRAAGPGMYVLVARPGDGAARGGSASLAVLATDLGITAWRGPQGLAVQMRSFADATPLGAVRLALMARNNDVLAEAMTGPDGLARFPAAALRGAGPLAPVAVQAFSGADFATLNLESAAFDLTDRGAEGRPHPGPLDAFLWLDRGIYRPGEVVRVGALLRDGGGQPVDLPARLRIRRPNGQVFFESVPERVAGAAFLVPVPLSASAPAGAWQVEVLADPDAPPIGTTSFRVDAFVPERLEVTAGPAPGPLVPGQALDVPVRARFLYGAPGAGLTGSAELRLAVEPEPFPAWRGWQFGLQDESFTPDLQAFDVPETDAEGRATLTLDLPQAPDTTRPLRAEVTVSMNEPGGRASATRLTLPVRSPGPLLAIRPAFEGGAVDAGAEAAFDLAAVSPGGEALAATLRVRLVRERPDWRIVVRERLARYETVWRDEPVDSAELRVAPGQPARFARSLPFGRYRLEVTQPGTLAIASYRFRAGWAQAESAEVPDRVDVAADRRAYAAGAVATLRLTPPFAGRASIAVLTDRLVSLREIDLPEAGAEVQVPVSADWGPGAHLAVTVFRPGSAPAGRPGRALGLAWIGLDPAARRLEVAIEAPDLARPRGPVQVPLRIAGASGQAMVTLAAVDEGILRLTRFASPDPVAHFLARRRLGLDIRDDYGRLIAPAEGEAAVLRQGGDGLDAAALLQVPQRTVALFKGPVTLDSDGRATVTLDLPDFAGELRLMAVAWDGARVGAASRPMTVREQAVAEAQLPRFLAPGDTARLPVLLHNVELPAGAFRVTLAATGAIALDGPASLDVNLAAGARALPATGLRAVAAGQGVLRLAVTGPGGFRTEREAAITVRSARPAVTEVAVSTLAPGATAALALPTERFLPGTWRATANWGAPVRYDPLALLGALRRFPLDCVEQAASRVLALSAAPANPDTAQEDAALLGRAIASVVDRQRYDGRFGYWSAEGQVQEWASLYATEALLRARAGGAPVPEAALEAALRAAEDDLEATGDTPEFLAVQAYRVHVLALAGRNRLGAARRLAEQLESLPTPLARAQLAAAFARAGDAGRAEAIFAAALAAPARRVWAVDFGSATRDALATALLLRESGVAQDRLPAVLARLPGADLTPAVSNTQEQAWAIAAAFVLGRDGRPARITLEGRDLPVAPVVTATLAAPGQVRNRGDAPVVQAVSIAGVPASPLPAAAQGMRVARRFLDLGGQPLNLDTLRAGTGFVLLLEARATTGDRHQAMLIQGLPAGWEIAGRLGPGEVQGMAWLGELTEADSQPARDDRFAAAVTLTAQQPLARLAVRVRAVSAGSFELPGMEAQDMYRPGILARQNAARITVLPAE